MDQNTIVDLTICQKCKERPAVYGDGLTWSRCSKCHLEENKETIPADPEPTPAEGFKHEIKKGVTSIILPVYMNSYTLFHYTGNCIGSIREHTNVEKTPYELVVIDNGSPIQPPALSSYYANRVIKNSENFGVTKAWNQGIRMSTGEYIVLMNNDVQVFSNWLSDFHTYLNEGGYDLVMAHPMYSLTEPFARAVEAARIRKEVLEQSNNDKKALIADFKDFSCVIFKRSLIDEIGLFDERFFSYCSDSDFFKRMEKAGKKWACARAVATSHISDATGFSIAETADIMNKDKALYEEKWKNVSVKTSKIVRTPETGDMIFLILNNEYHHIKDPDTLHALGFDFGQEEIIAMNDLTKSLRAGEEISMKNYEKYT